MRLLIFVIVLTTRLAFGQDPQSSQFYANPSFQNPANVGEAGTSRFIFNYRNQWPALKAFQTTGFSFDTQLFESNWGVGAQFINDRQGPAFQNNSLALQASRFVMLNYDQTAKLNFGLQTTLFSLRFDPNDLNFADQFSSSGISSVSSDPLKAGTLTKHTVDFAGGIKFEYEPNQDGNYWWVGATVHHLGKSIQTQNGSIFSQRIGVQAGLTIPISLNLWNNGHAQEWSREKTVSFTTAFRQQGGSFQLDCGINLAYSPIVLGLWYRNLPLRKFNGFSQRDALVFLTAFQKDNFMFQYSYDLTVSSLGYASGGAHEITIWYGIDSIFDFKGRTSGKKRSRRCPTI